MPSTMRRAKSAFSSSSFVPGSAWACAHKGSSRTTTQHQRARDMTNLLEGQVQRGDYTARRGQMHEADLMRRRRLELAVADLEVSRFAEISAAATNPVGDPLDQPLGRHARRTE